MVVATGKFAITATIHANHSREFPSYKGTGFITVTVGYVTSLELDTITQLVSDAINKITGGVA